MALSLLGYNTMRIHPWALCGGLLATVTGGLNGQTLPGKNLSVAVRVRAVMLRADTVTISYSLVNSGSSAERLLFFTVNSPIVPVEVDAPVPTSDWSTRTIFNARNVARWTALQGIAPGDSTPSLTFRARGLPAIQSAWYRGDSLITINSDDSTTTVPYYDPLLNLSNQVQTVGVDLAPTSFSALVSRLHVLSDSSCALQWITNGGLCISLGTDLSATPTHVFTFSASLDSASAHGGDVAEAAYRLLRTNADFITAFVDTSLVQLHVVCAGTWLIRNLNYGSFVGTWSTTAGGHSTAVTVGGRTSDAQEYTDLQITSDGTTLNLYYNGVLLRTRERGTTSCH